MLLTSPSISQMVNVFAKYDSNCDPSIIYSPFLLRLQESFRNTINMKLFAIAAALFSSWNSSALAGSVEIEVVEFLIPERKITLTFQKFFFCAN